VSALLDILLDVDGNGLFVAEIRKLLGGGPGARIPAEAWNADRLNEFLGKLIRRSRRVNTNKP
jgi:hypothetical protein